MRKVGWWSVVVVVAAVVAVATPTSAKKINSRELEKQMQLARTYIDKDPAELSKIVVWTFARPAGADSRILAFCDEVIVKSRTVESALRGTDCVTTAIDFHKDEILKKKLGSKVRVAAKHAVAKELLPIKLAGANLLLLLDEKNPAAANQAYAQIFQDASTRSLSDDDRWALIRSIRQFSTTNLPEVRTAIAQLTQKQKLIEFFKQNMSDERAPGRGADLERLLVEWGTLIKN